MSNKEWRIVEVVMPISDSRPKWVVSRKKLSDAELDNLYNKGAYTFDADDELGINAIGRFICGTITIYGGTKAEAEAECERLNNGGNIFDSFPKEVFEQESNEIVKKVEKAKADYESLKGDD